MTIGEVHRAIESKNRVYKREAQEKAVYDYTLAQLIIKGVSMTLGSKATFPTINEAYPNIFDDIVKAQEEQLEKQKIELSILRFKQFAQSYNNNFKNKEVRNLNNE